MDVGAELGVAAVAYATRGWWVFPLRPRAKTPITRHGVQDASSDPAVVGAWWAEWPDANIGLDVYRSGLVVVDLDPGKGGVATWEALCADYHLAPYTTLQSRTGSGGMHLIYAASIGLTIRNSTEKLGPGIDVRGKGGYIVLPPSVHPSGNRYQWIVNE